MMNPSDRTCEQLAAAAKSGDNDALGHLAERWWPRVRQWTFVDFGTRPLMEDVAQDALVKLFERIEIYDSRRPFGPWLRVLVRNCGRDALRRQRPSVPMIELSDHRDPARPLDMKTGASLVLAAFTSLSRRERQVIDLCDRQGLSVREVAGELEIAPATVRVLLHTSRKRLRLKMLENHPEVLDLIRETV